MYIVKSRSCILHYGFSFSNLSTKNAMSKICSIMYQLSSTRAENDDSKSPEAHSTLSPKSDQICGCVAQGVECKTPPTNAPDAQPTYTARDCRETAPALWGSEYANRKYPITFAVMDKVVNISLGHLYYDKDRLGSQAAPVALKPVQLPTLLECVDDNDIRYPTIPEEVFHVKRGSW